MNEQPTMHILVLGATGRTGKYILEQALQRGHTVNILVWDKSKVNTIWPSSWKKKHQ